MTGAQLGIFDGMGYPAPVRLTRADVLERAAEDYLAAHPGVWQAFTHYALQLVDAGRGRYSAKAIVERIRWETAIRGAADFKINNSHVATFARIFAETHPQHAGLFAFRERTSERRAA